MLCSSSNQPLNSIGRKRVRVMMRVQTWSGVPTGIHFAFTDRLMRGGNGITIRGKPFFQVGRDKPSQTASDQLTLPQIRRRPAAAPRREMFMCRVSGDQTNSETELEGFSPSSNLICNYRKGASVTRQDAFFEGGGDTETRREVFCDFGVRTM